MSLSRPSHARWLLVVLVAVSLVSTTARAHETVPSGGPAVGLASITALIVATGLVGGVLAVEGRRSARGVVASRWIARAVGPLLLGIGAVTAASVLTQQPVIGLAGLALGVTGGVLVVLRGGCGVCADATVGAVATHRLVEGVALAAAYAAGSSIGLLGTGVLAAHTTVECVAVGGRDGFDRRRAIAAVAFVAATFVAGILLGTVGVVDLPAVPQIALLAVVGGLLSVLGTDAVRSDHGGVSAG